jgi:magnesium chelatase family protein
MAKEQGYKQVFLPAPNALEAGIVKGITIYPVTSLSQLVAHLMGLAPITPQSPVDFKSLLTTAGAEFDFADIAGQESAKRALEIAATGGHNLLMVGTPGAGKTMMSRAFAGILPTLTESEAIEITKIFSVTGNLKEGDTLVTTRPFRSPHHTTSKIGLIGGGSKPMPGEVSLAHRGVLFLDEFPEFPRDVIESLRQPMEDGVVQISRAAGTMRYPAQFTLIAAANPCPCGYAGSRKKPCTCMPGNINRYKKKISGPIVDRIDLHLAVPEVPVVKLAGKIQLETSKQIQARVETARDLQRHRFHHTAITCNAELSGKNLAKYSPLLPESEKILIEAANNLNLSARSYNKMIKVARTIADLAGETSILPKHITEAIQYRPKTDDF